MKRLLLYIFNIIADIIDMILFIIVVALFIYVLTIIN